MALSVVDAHVREKLIWLRQQQEDMTILLSQVSTACLHCEKTLQQVGWQVICMAKYMELQIKFRIQKKRLVGRVGTYKIKTIMIQHEI